MNEELDMAVKAGRTTTHKREDLDRGAEPDQCYWLGENARRMAGKRRLDLALDPPPDLAIEVDITRSSLDRLPIFAALGVCPNIRAEISQTHTVYELVDFEPN